ncbi:hypothetical protein ABIA31_000608 [Catenulispora sp. MAP5-51]
MNSRSSGVFTMITASAARHSTPPLTRAAAPDVAAAVRPARRLPSSGPACPAICSAAATRPSISSGVFSWTTVLRETTARVSAAPATARHARPSQALETRPSVSSAAPQTVEPSSMTAPGRGSLVNVPENTEAVTPPTAIAARNRPRVRGLPPKRSALSSGNRLTGMVSTVVARSVSSAPRTGAVCIR